MSKLYPAFIFTAFFFFTPRNDKDEYRIPVPCNSPHFADKDFHFSDLTEYKGKLYGVSKRGGSKGWGTIFEWDPATNTYVKKFEFNDSSGTDSRCQLILKDRKFYGITMFAANRSERHPHGIGTIFEWDPATNIFTRKIAFDEKQGYPGRSYDLYLKDGKFYGVLMGGTETNRYGSVFEWDPLTNKLQTKLAFDSTDAGPPQGSLILRKGKFYGIVSDKYDKGKVTRSGGIFEWDPEKNTQTIKFHFSWDNGTTVARGLTLFGDKFYGLCIKSTESVGVLFEWDPDTNEYTKKYEFKTKEEGGFPRGCLAIFKGKLYGMTNSYASKPGCIFEWDPAKNTLTKKVELEPESEIHRNGTLTLKGGKFYGVFYMVEYGSANRIEDRFLFEWDPEKNSYKKKRVINKKE